MALIKCPECGRSVSEMASSCPDCGYPIAGNISGEVYFKIMAGMGRKMTIANEEGITLGEGCQNQVIQIHVNCPTRIQVSGGGFRKSDFVLVKPGERYNVAPIGCISLILKLGVNKVDVID